MAVCVAECVGVCGVVYITATCSLLHSGSDPHDASTDRASFLPKNHHLLCPFFGGKRPAKIKEASYGSLPLIRSGSNDYHYELVVVNI